MQYILPSFIRGSLSHILQNIQYQISPPQFCIPLNSTQHNPKFISTADLQKYYIVSASKYNSKNIILAWLQRSLLLHKQVLSDIVDSQWSFLICFNHLGIEEDGISSIKSAHDVYFFCKILIAQRTTKTSRLLPIERTLNTDQTSMIFVYQSSYRGSYDASSIMWGARGEN